MVLGQAGWVIHSRRPLLGVQRSGVHAFEDGAVVDVVEHLGLALEVVEAGGRAELGLDLVP